MKFIPFQLNKTANMYGKISERYAALYQQSFDADPSSLQNVLLYPFFNSPGFKEYTEILF